VSKRTLWLTAAALACFAGNSLLCRLALAERRIDAAGFTALRLASGALVLWLLTLRTPRPAGPAGSWGSALALFAYAAPFSFAYLRLGAGVGALVLFGAVQATMLGWGIARGERPGTLVWLGLVLAVGGLAGIALPGATAPDPLALVAMAAAGIAWGVYSLRGRGAGDPLRATAANFARSLPFGLVLAAATYATLAATPAGAALAIASGAVASGLGYTAWYGALRHLSATRAAVLQLLVPVLAAAGGVALLGERVSLRLVLCATAILGGVALAIRSTGRSPTAR
jgi:drug/metabolite transporter (DMT)-like permease